eukprot:231884_1
MPLTGKLTARKICGIIYVCICLCLITPLLLYYLYQYYKLYKIGKMGIRRKHFYIILIMETAIILLISINRPIVVFTTFFNLNNLLLDRINRFCFILSLYAILSSFLMRIWILMYDTKLNQWHLNNAWKRVINAEKNNADWYRSNRHKYGSSIRIGFWLVIVWLINCIIHYSLYIYSNHNSKNNFEAYFQITSVSIYAICIFIIYIKLPKNRDIFRLRDELKLSLYIALFIIIIFAINTLWLKDTIWQYNYFEQIVYLLCCSGIGLMSTAFVLFIIRYNAIKTFHGATIKIGSKLDRITLSKKKSLSSKQKKQSSIVNAHTPDSDRNDNHNIDIDHNIDMNVSFVAEKFNYVLGSEPQFELFMSHIKKEFSMENMLALIEFCQYEDAIIEQMDQLDDRKTFFKKYNFLFYSNIPKSQIVHDKSMDIWEKHVKLFSKYIKIGSEYELNLSYQIRTQNTKLCQDIINKTKDCNLHRVLDCVEEILTSIRALLFDSFSRFDGTFHQPLNIKLQLSTMRESE